MQHLHNWSFQCLFEHPNEWLLYPNHFCTVLFIFIARKTSKVRNECQQASFQLCCIIITLYPVLDGPLGLCVLYLLIEPKCVKLRTLFKMYIINIISQQWYNTPVAQIWFLLAQYITESLPTTPIHSLTEAVADALKVEMSLFINYTHNPNWA